MTYRERYQLRRSQGLCVRCAEPTRGCLCRNCQTYHSQKASQNRAKRAQKHLCYKCENRAKRGFKHCQKHLEINRELSRRFYWEHK